GTLKVSGVNVTQTQLDSFFPKSTPTPTPTPTHTPIANQIVVTPATLTLPSGSSQTVTVSLPSQPSGNVTVTATPDTGITVTPTTLNFTPTVFSGTVTVKSVAAPGTKGTVKFSASGYTDKVADVTVEQSSSIVVSPASLEIPTAGTGLKTFDVKLAAAPSAPVTITITPPTGFTTNKASLVFNALNFSTNQTVTVTTTAPAGTTDVIKLFSPDVGQFDVEVKAIPAAAGQFFVDPVNGNNANPGTAIQPFQTVKHALTTAVVSSAANTIGSGTGGGTDVTVTVVGPGTETLTANTASLALTKGSVTVIGPAGFNLDLNSNQLTLNKGYKLQGFKITSGNTTASQAINLAGEGTSLKNMTIDCTGFGSVNTTCVQVTAANTTLDLEGLTLSIKGNQDSTVAIDQTASNTTLNITASTVKSTGTGGKDVVGIQGVGKLVVTTTTVDFSTVASGTNGSPTIAIQLGAAGSAVQSSVIKINGTVANQSGAIGVKATTAGSFVTGTTFTTETDTVGIGIKNSGNVNADAGTVNSFPIAPAKVLFKNLDP
ncbi:hypothetical protein NW863_11815, partial [Synechococcus sp. B60.1]